MDKVRLKGITWDHSRGVTPLLAAAQRYSELYPEVEITWQKRKLQEFADKPVELLSGEYDLLIVDHPWAGRIANSKCFLALDEHLPAAYLADQSINSVGGSHNSYYYEGHQWCLAIDASTPVTSFRADLFEKNNAQVPRNWEELLAFADTGRMLIPGIPVDSLMAFYMFCIAHGQEPFQSPSTVVDKETGLTCLESMSILWRKCDKIIYQLNPIAVAEIMSSTNDYWYCPFAYGYSNYSRRGFAKYKLTYTDLPFFNGNKRLRSTVGGAGLAVSAMCRNKEHCLQFAKWICSGETQSTFYVQHGGQPGHKSAWLDEDANHLCNNFFFNVLPAMERGYIRPRYDGYLHFQDNAGETLSDYLRNGGDPGKVLCELDDIYRLSFKMLQQQ